MLLPSDEVATAMGMTGSLRGTDFRTCEGALRRDLDLTRLPSVDEDDGAEDDGGNAARVALARCAPELDDDEAARAEDEGIYGGRDAEDCFLIRPSYSSCSSSSLLSYRRSRIGGVGGALPMWKTTADDVDRGLEFALAMLNVSGRGRGVLAVAAWTSSSRSSHSTSCRLAMAAAAAAVASASALAATTRRFEDDNAEDTADMTRERSPDRSSRATNAPLVSDCTPATRARPEPADEAEFDGASIAELTVLLAAVALLEVDVHLLRRRSLPWYVKARRSS
jgi:hypothetical protein